MNVSRDIYEYLTNFADDRVILNMLSVNKQFRDEQFFRRVMERKYPAAIPFKPENKSWKQYYIETVYYVEEIEKMLGYHYSKTAQKSPKVYYTFIKTNLKSKEALLAGASAEGDIDLVKFLLQNFSLDKNDALERAAQNGKLEIVKYLVQQGANIHTGKDWALRLASKYGHLEVVKYLIEKGANIHAENDDALNLASRYNHLNVVKYLVEHGSNIHTDNNFPLNIAIEEGYSDIIEYLSSLY